MEDSVAAEHVIAERTRINETLSVSKFDTILLIYLHAKENLVSAIPLIQNV